MSDVLTSLRTGHVGLNVTDLDRSRDFYQRVFGLQVTVESTPDVEPGHRHAFLARDGQLILTLWQQAAEEFRKGAAGLHHLSFQVDTIEEVRAAEQTLRELGAAFQYEGVVPHREGADSGGIFFTDPDGTRLEIFTARGAGEAAAPHSESPTCGFF
jgi:lactoylglutathione lyase